MKSVALRRIAQIVNGGTPTTDPELWDGGIPWVTPVDMAKVDGGLLRGTERTLTPLGVTRGSSLTPAGSVLLSCRAPIGYTALADQAVSFNQGCKAIVPTPSLTSRYLQYALASAKSQLTALGSGSTFLELSSESLASLRIPEMAAERQQRISDFLDDRVARIDKIIATRRAQIDSVQGFYAAWLAEWTATMGARSGWAPLRRFGVQIEQGWSPEADSAPAAEGEAGVLKLGSVRGGAFRPDENKAFLEGTSPRREYKIREGDLLVTRANTPTLVGDAAVACGVESRNLYLSDLIYRLALGQLDPHFASAALRAPRVRQLIGVIARGTSGSMPKLRGEDIMDLPVPALRLAEQSASARDDIVARSDRDARVATLSASIDLLTEYKQSLITAAVTGELDVTTAGSGIPG